MKHPRRLILLAALILGAGSSSQAQFFDWAVAVGSSEISVETADAVHLDAVGNVYVTGQFTGVVDFDLGPNAFPLGPTSTDVFVAKYTKDLDLYWAVRFGGAPSGARVWVTSVTTDFPGNVIAVGYFEGTVDFDPGVGVFNLTASGAQDGYVVKLDSAGHFVWARRLGGPSFDEPHRVDVDSSGNVYTAGHFSGTSDFDPGGGVFSLTSAVGMYATFVSKLDPGGNFIWARGFTGTGGSFCFGLAIGPGGDLNLAGNLAGTVDFDPGPGVSNLTAVGQSDVWVARLSSGGALVWAKAFGGATNDMAADLAVESSNVYVTGQFQGAVDFDPGVGVFTLTAGGSSDAFVAKLGNDGGFLWARQIGGPGSQVEVPRGIGVDANADLHVGGYFTGTADFDPGAATFPLTSTIDGGDDVFAAELDGAGNFLWASAMGGSCLGAGCFCCGDDRALGVAVDPEGHTYMVGYFRGKADFDPAGNTQFFLTSQNVDDDMFLSKLSPAPLSGTTPDGDGAPGVMLTLRKGSSGQIIFQWGASCRHVDNRYGLYEGTLGNFTSHVPMSCTVFATSVGRVPGAGDRYYLVVPSEETVEGSYGVDGDGNERPPSAAACHPQSFETCVP